MHEEKIPEETEKQDKTGLKWVFIIVLIIIGCFAAFFISKYVASTTGHATIEEQHQMNLEGESYGENYMYNGHSFVKVGNMWNTQVQYGDTLFNLMLRYGPKELENVGISGKLNTEEFNQASVYITFNPDDENLQFVALSATDLSLAFTKALGVKPVAACAKNMTEACENRPIITCESNKPAIYIQQSQEENKPSIIFDGNCIIIKGKDWDVVKATDRFLLGWYKIMPIA